MNNLIETAQAAEIIAVPKGKDCKKAVVAFSEATGIEVPKFEERTYKATSQGKTFYSVSAKDVAKIVARGFADVGITGQDQFLERMLETPNVTAQQIGEQMCTLSLLTRSVWVNYIRELVYSPRNGKPVSTATSFPNITTTYAALNDLNMGVTETFQGSVEVMSELARCDAVVDIVGEGRTMRAQDLGIIENILEVYPVIVGRN